MEELREKAIKFYNAVTQNGKVNAEAFRQSANTLSGMSFGQQKVSPQAGIILGLSEFITYLEENVCPAPGPKNS